MRTVEEVLRKEPAFRGEVLRGKEVAPMEVYWKGNKYSIKLLSVSLMPGNLPSGQYYVKHNQEDHGSVGY